MAIAAGHSTYDEKEYLKKEKEAHWNSWFRKWWSKRNDIAELLFYMAIAADNKALEITVEEVTG